MIYFSLAAQSKRNAQCSKNLENLQRWNQRQRPINPREVGQENFRCKVHTGTAYAKIGDYILGVVFHPKPSSVSDVAGIQSVHASLN